MNSTGGGQNGMYTLQITISYLNYMIESLSPEYFPVGRIKISTSMIMIKVPLICIIVFRKTLKYNMFIILNP